MCVHQVSRGGEDAFAKLRAMSPLQLCILSSEIMPYAKSGGLADVAGALLRNLRIIGHDVRAFMPLYPVVRRNYPQIQPVLGLQQLSMQIGGTDYGYAIHTASFPGADIPVYFVDCPALFDRPSLYTTDPDEHRRFVFFTRAALESCRRLNFLPQVFHCNDWHTALLPLYLKTLYAGDAQLSAAKSIMTIHNIGYQGVMSSSVLPDLGLGLGWTQLDQGDLTHGVINPLKTGIKYADRVTTVSPTYAREISDSSLGMGMEGTLRARTDKVVGILNGVDYEDWDPRHDRYLNAHFTPKDLRGKRMNKDKLLATMELTRSSARPLIGMVTRLAEQKGIDLLFEALPYLLDRYDFGLAVLGSGEPQYQSFFHELGQRYRGKVSYRAGYDEALAHLIEAGSDMFLMPSRYEPCGLNQMYSLRYGTIPIVRHTGGLADSVQHFDPASGQGTGCVFNDFDVPAVRWAVETTLSWFGQPFWQQLIQNAMSKDFSWGKQISEYDRLYRSLVG
jgi:starch synthase